MGNETAQPATGGASRHHEVTAADLPLHCPPKGVALWSAHPRVFLPVKANGRARCPYCGAEYVLKGGAGRH